MELKFLGRGAAFNPKEGNTSAWFIENNELFLIDCGESVYRKCHGERAVTDFLNVYLSDYAGS